MEEDEAVEGVPLFDEEVYNMLREDSLVRRLGSYSFSQLVSSPSPQLQQQQQQQEQPQDQHHYQYVIPSTYCPTAEPPTPEIQPHHYHPQQENLQQQHVQLSHSYPHQQLQLGEQQQIWEQEHQIQVDNQWDSVDDHGTLHTVDDRGSLNPGTNLSNERLLAPDPVPVSNGVLSLQPWGGQYNFTVAITTNNKDRNKWCFSKVTNKLYLRPCIAIPLDVTVHPWVDAKVRIMPVFQQSQYRMEPVLRCYNCKTTKVCDERIIEHIVQVESECCRYEVLPDERPVVTLPLSRPPPGESSSILLVKMMCLTSCVGGPNRRPFSLVVTLHCNSTGREIGRQIVEVKCSKCPGRDMKHDESQTPRSETPPSEPPAPVLDNDKKLKVAKLASQIKVGKKRKKPSSAFEYEAVTKVEPGTESGFVNVSVPAEFEQEVKKFVNSLMAAKFLGRSHPELLLYPEVEKENTDPDEK